MSSDKGKKKLCDDARYYKETLPMKNNKNGVKKFYVLKLYNTTMT